jgi:hypothetical protein
MHDRPACAAVRLCEGAVAYGFKFDPKALQPPLPEDFKIAASKQSNQRKKNSPT